MQKPFSSHFSSIASQGLPGSITKNFEKMDKQMINKFLRETFSGVLPSENGFMSLLQKQTQNLGKNPNTESNNLNDDVNEYMQPMPGSFVCTGGTEFDYES